MELTNLLESMSVNGLKLFTNQDQKFYTSNQMVILDTEIKTKPNVDGVENIKSEDDISSVWLKGVPFNFMEYFTWGDMYIDKLLSTKKDQTTIVIKTKNIKLANGIGENYLNKGKYPIINTGLDYINSSPMYNIFNHNIKKDKELSIVESDVSDLKGKINPTSLEQLGNEIKNKKYDKLKQIKSFIDENGFDDYNYDLLATSVLGNNKIDGLFDKNREDVKKILEKLQL